MFLIKATNNYPSITRLNRSSARLAHLLAFFYCWIHYCLISLVSGYHKQCLLIRSWFRWINGTIYPYYRMLNISNMAGKNVWQMFYRNKLYFLVIFFFAFCFKINIFLRVAYQRDPPGFFLFACNVYLITKNGILPVVKPNGFVYSKSICCERVRTRFSVLECEHSESGSRLSTACLDIFWKSFLVIIWRASDLSSATRRLAFRKFNFLNGHFPGILCFSLQLKLRNPIQVTWFHRYLQCIFCIPSPRYGRILAIYPPLLSIDDAHRRFDANIFSFLI